MNLKNSFSTKTLTLFILIFLFFSCASRKDIIYYQNIEDINGKQNTNSYEVKIKADDLLMIVVSAEDPEIAIPFNLTTAAVPSSNVTSVGGQQSMQTYLVDSEGMIDFPILGKLQIGGMTRTELTNLLHEKISKYIKKPIVNIRITNFKISVQGEVIAPGTFDIRTERVTLPEALSMARDLTIYGKRNNILVIREVNGLKSFNRVDITKADFMNSPFYYLTQNDVVYVEPNDTKVNGSKVGPNTGVIISITSLLITITTLIIANTK